VTRDTDPITKRLEQIEAPAAAAAFYDELRSRLDAHRNKTLLRWKRATVVSAIVAIGGICATGVMALSHGSSSIDRTMTCPVPESGGVHSVSIVTQANQVPGPLAGGNDVYPNPAMLNVGIRLTALITVRSGDSFFGKEGYLLNTTFCTAAKNVPLRPRGLPLIANLKARDEQKLDSLCWISSRMRMRVAVQFTDPSKPASAKVALETPRRRPIAYVDWSPARVRVYASRSLCHTS
jgi:hypothetical protein